LIGARLQRLRLIVTSRLADECLWAEALNIGAYDVLAKPFDRNEVRRSESLACLHWNDKQHKDAAPAAATAGARVDDASGDAVLS